MGWFWWIVIIIIGLIVLYFVLTTNIASRVYAQAIDVAYNKYGPKQTTVTVDKDDSTRSEKGAGKVRDESDARLSKPQRPTKNTYAKEQCPTVNAIIEDVEYEWDDLSKSLSSSGPKDKVLQVNKQLPNIIQEVNESGVKWKSQEICCRIMETFTGEKFERNAKPWFLKNPETKRSLEVDCYNEKYGGLEFNGIQHYRYPNPFHKTEEDFIKYIRKDKYKVSQFERVGKNLIVVPYTIDKSDLADFISSRLPDDGDFFRN
jgi:hypothetical protein